MAEPTTTTEEKRPGLLVRTWRRLTGRGRTDAEVLVAKGMVTSQGDIGWSTFGGNRISQFYKGSNTNWTERAGILWENPAVALCISYLFDKVVEPTLELVKLQGAELVAVENPAGALALLVHLLQNPNPEYDGKSLLQSVTLSYKLAGNAYIVKVRSGSGIPIELWYIPHWQMEPVAPEDGGPTREYKRTIFVKGQKVTTVFAREDVIHFRRGLDPSNQRRGMDLFRAMLRELVTDGQIATYTAGLLTNMGVTAGIVGSANAEEPLSPDERDQLKELLDERTTGDNAGSWVVSSLPLKIDTLGFSPQTMALHDIGERPEARVLAAFGFNAMAIGLPSDDKKYANLKESREMAIESGIIPMLADVAGTLTAELLPDFDPSAVQSVGQPRTTQIRFNYALVRDLQGDVDKLSTRYVAEWAGGVRKLSEARAALGLPETGAEPDGFIWQLAPKNLKSPTSTDPKSPAP